MERISKAGIVFFISFLFLWPVTAAAKIQVDRIWSVDLLGGSAFALVTYTNDTHLTYRSVVIQCTALDEHENKLGVDETWISKSLGYPPITPGFMATVEVIVDLHGAKMKTMSCEVSKQL